MPGWVREGALEEAWDETLVENEADISVRFEDQPDRPRMRCGYCDAEAQPHTPAAALRWFHSHLCSVAYIHEKAAA